MNTNNSALQWKRRVQRDGLQLRLRQRWREHFSSKSCECVFTKFIHHIWMNGFVCYIKRAHFSSILNFISFVCALVRSFLFRFCFRIRFISLFWRKEIDYTYTIYIEKTEGSGGEGEKKSAWEHEWMKEKKMSFNTSVLKKIFAFGKTL